MNEEPVHDDLHTEKLSDMMTRAEAGDLLAAREVVEILAAVVSPTDTYRDPHSDDPNARVPVPIPDFVRAYLSCALEKIASGVDARDAFHLRKKGGPRQFWAHRDKVLAVDIMQQLVEQGLVVDEAAREAAAQINDFAKRSVNGRLASPWKKFSERPIENHTLLKWYYKLNPNSRQE
jgi:hypothetical protein